MAAYVVLTDLGGISLQVNPELVTSLTLIPVALLPVGIPAGTLVRSADSPDVSVQGTVAATATALVGAPGGLSAYCAGAGGFQAAPAPAPEGILSNVRTGVGAYTITLTAALATGGFVLAAANDSNRILQVNGVVPTGSTFAVNLTDAGGLAADGNFVVKVFRAA